MDPEGEIESDPGGRYCGIPEVLCPSCVKSIPEDAVFCIHCRAPVNFIAGSVPYYQVFAQGYIWRKAAESPQRLIVVIGIWAIFLPPLIGMIASAMAMPSPASGDGGRLEWGIGGFWLVSYAALCAAIIWRTTRNYLRPGDTIRE